MNAQEKETIMDENVHDIFVHFERYQLISIFRNQLFMKKAQSSRMLSIIS